MTGLASRIAGLWSVRAPTRPPNRKRKDDDETLAEVGSASGRTAKAGGTAT